MVFITVPLHIRISALDSAALTLASVVQEQQKIERTTHWISAANMGAALHLWIVRELNSTLALISSAALF